MQNWDRVLELQAESENSAGMQALMHAKAMESINSKIELFNVSWQEFISNLSDSDTFKVLIESATNLLNIFNSTTKPLGVIILLMGLLSSKTKKLNDSIIKTFGDWGKNKKKSITDTFNILTGKNGKLLNQDNKKIPDSSLNIDKAKIERLKQINKLLKQNEKEQLNEIKKPYKKEVQELEKTGLPTSDAQTMMQKMKIQKVNELENEHNKLLKEQEKINKDITKEKEKQSKAITKNNKKEAKNKELLRQSLGESLQAIGSITSMIGVGIENSITSGIVSGVSGLLIAAGQFASKNYIGSAVTAITSLGQLIQIGGKSDAIKKEDMNSVVDKISNAAQKLSNTKLQINGAETALQQYKELSNKIYLTGLEQEKMNKLAQELSDSFDGVDLITDDYGNLRVSIDSVTKSIKKLKETYSKDYGDLVDIEKDAFSKYDKGYSVSYASNKDFVEAFRSENYSKYRNFLTGINDDRTARGISNSDFASFNNSLKDAIIDTTLSTEKLTTLIKDHRSIVKEITKAQENLDKYLETYDWEDVYGVLDRLNTYGDELSYNQALSEIDIYLENIKEKLGETSDEYQVLVTAINNTKFNNEMLNYFDKIESELEGVAFDPNTENVLGYIGKNKFQLKAELSQTYEQLKDMDDKEFELWLSQRKKIVNVLKDTDIGTINFLGNIDFQDAINEMTADEASNNIGVELSEMIKKLDLSQYETDASKYNVLLKYYYDHKDEMSEQLVGAYQKIIENAFNNMPITTNIKFSELATDIEASTDSLTKLNSVIQSVKDNGGMTLKEFGELASILDELNNMSNLFNLDEIERYNTALDKLNVQLDANKGLVTADGEALKNLQQIQELATKTKIKSKIDELKATLATAKVNAAYIDAEIAGVDAAIKAAEMGANAQGMEAEAKTAATNSFTEASGKIVENYKSEVESSQKWATATISNISKVSQAYNEYFTARINNQEADVDKLEQYSKDIVKANDFTWGFQNKTINWKSGDTSAIVAELQDYRAGLQNTKKQYETQIKFINAEITTLENLYKTDLSKLGTSNNSKTAKEVEAYIGKLEEIYNLLRKIEGISARISHLEKYEDISRGENYVKYLKERFELNKSELELNKQLLAQQKYREQHEQSDILNLAPKAVSEVFSFDEYGNVQIAWDKYNNLSDKHKKLVDDLYDEYKDLHEETLKYYEDSIESLKSTITIQKQFIDTYLSFEEGLAKAVKNIYKEMLDNKIKAIDTEIKALEDLKKAYDEVNKAQEDAKELSKLQIGLQRSLMDTSGASNTKVLSYKDQINSKLEGMGQDAYSKRLDEIKESLEDQKQQLQDDFNEFFKDWKELYNLVDTYVMSDKQASLAILQSTQEWKEGSEGDRQLLLDDWNTKWLTSMEILEQGGISPAITALQDLKDSISGLDTTLQNKEFIEDIGTLLSRVLLEYQNDKGSSSSGSSGKSSSGSGSYNTTSTSSSTSTTKYTIEFLQIVDGKTLTVTSAIKCKKGSSIKLPEAPKNPGNYTFLGWTPDNGSKVYQPGNSYKPTKDTKFYAWWRNSGGVKTKDRQTQATATQRTQTGITKTSTSAATKVSVKEKRANLYDSNMTSKSTTTYGRTYKATGLTKTKNGIEYYEIEVDGKKYFIRKSDVTAMYTPYATGGLANFSGPAWLDGTKSAPEYVLSAAQTKAFLRLTDALVSPTKGINNNIGSSITIGQISFEVDSMSSPEDGRKAFDVFVKEFNKIGSQKGISINRL